MMGSTNLAGFFEYIVFSKEFDLFKPIQTGGGGAFDATQDLNLYY